jgi:hypothetical protein
VARLALFPGHPPARSPPRTFCGRRSSTRSAPSVTVTPSRPSVVSVPRRPIAPAGTRGQRRAGAWTAAMPRATSHRAVAAACLRGGRGVGFAAVVEKRTGGEGGARAGRPACGPGGLCTWRRVVWGRRKRCGARGGCVKLWGPMEGGDSTYLLWCPVGRDVAGRFLYSGSRSHGHGDARAS